MLCIVWGATYSCFADEMGKESFLTLMLNKSIELYCQDAWFLRNTRLKTDECAGQLRTYGSKCNKLILPLIPTPADVNEENVMLYRNVGELYAMCIVAKSFQALD